MTAAEYARLYREARGRFPAVQQEVLDRIIEAYTIAGKSVSKIVADSELAGQSSLTIDSWSAIRDQLRLSATDLAETIESEIPDGITKAYYQTKQNPGYALIDAQYMIDVFDAEGSGKITKAGLANLSARVNEGLIFALVNREYDNGINFVKSIWNDLTEKGLPDGIFGDYQYRIENIINAGLAQGRDPVQIAKDIELYVKEEYLKAGIDTGPLITKPGRWGRLIPGTGEYIRRIASRPDWRAIRLLRSELYHAMQDAAIQQGLINVASTKMYNWFKTRGNPIDPDGSKNASGFRCIDLEEFNPYSANDIPGYQHPNCSCRIQAELIDGRKFNKDVKAWLQGEDIPYIEEWYNNIYLVAQA